MKDECEVTQISLDNVAELIPEHGPIRFIEHVSVWEDNEYTRVYFADGNQHVATGFGVGYPGTGPDGLYRLITDAIFMGRTDITRRHVQQEWKAGDGKVRLILNRQGVGKPLLVHPGMDCEYDLEIW